MKNWPQIPAGVAEVEYRQLIGSPDEPKPRSRHPDQIYSPVGDRATDACVQRLIDAIGVTAADYGYPDQPSGQARIQFDRAAASALRDEMDISWADAGSTRLWSFVSLVALPHLTYWRFGFDNRERWIASDLTRHTWSRLWWQAVVFQDHEELLGRLQESELNQLQERRIIGGDPRLISTFALAVLEANADVPRRRLIRDATKRLRRILVFVDPLALDDGQVREMCVGLVKESATQIQRSVV
ncbi:hypothetical protein [[Mycobacterium] nativiensis]|uniref:Uncharacterized protein n=1 Tax=[Mycobacterium] nativiensis TaxID=2855503 RepID=A0ABU5XVR9_9MYCO|nr:hypothetical protein [Mycolicibacter sp. MYC340]MEB3032086.1 hypothetical protein [Mycolicibacter sp. MYC340]